MVVAQPVTHLLVVARGGIVQSEAAGHYSRVGSTLTFSDDFDGTERVIVAYEGPAGSSSGTDSELRTYIRTIMAVLDPSGPPPPPP